jgi:hypothetical protein
MLDKLRLAQILVLISAAGLLTQCTARTAENQNNVSINTSGEISRPADEAKIEGNIPDYEISETSLEYLQSLPMPDVQLVFELRNNQKRIDLPADVKSALSSHWKEAIKFAYETRLHKPTDAQTAYKRDTDWANYCQETHRKLQTMLIEAPTGKRNISQTEAQNLWGFLNGATVKVMDKAKIF